MPLDHTVLRSKASPRIREEAQIEVQAEARARARAQGLAEEWAQGWMEGWAEGWAQGRAQNILRVLDLHGFDITADTRDRILRCTDLDDLDRWFDHALIVTGLVDPFV
jgi:hypothetical protein